jgi:hypothetical protein
MLYKFKSRATGDLIMLEPNGRQILQVIGKPDTEGNGKGILLPQEMPAALQAIEAAIAQDDDLRQQAKASAATESEDASADLPSISLRQRATPFIDMVHRCMDAQKEIVWGV